MQHFSWHERLVGFLDQLVFVTLMHFLLILHSAMVRVPEEQPYRFLTYAGRVLFTMTIVISILTLFDYLVE